MRHSLVLATLLQLAALIGCARKAAEVHDPVQAPSLPPGPVAAVWFDVGYPPPGFTGEMQRLIVGVWGDGRIVWSDDRAKGGKPYHTAQIDPAKVAVLLDDLDYAGLFGEPREVNFGPDASYTVVAASSGEKRKWLGSWHEPSRDDPNLVIDQRGLYRLNPGEARPAPSPEYAHFLGVWARSRKLIEAVIPPTGQPLETLDPAVFKLGRKPR